MTVAKRDKAKDLKEGLDHAIKEYKKTHVTTFKQRAKRVKKEDKAKAKANKGSWMDEQIDSLAEINDYWHGGY